MQSIATIPDGNVSENRGDAGNNADPAIIFDPTNYTGFNEQVGSPTTGGDDDRSGRNPIDPATGKRRRGRPPGAGKRQTQTGSINLSGIEKLLLGIHNTLSSALTIPELEMEASEASDIAKAYADVADYYPVLKMNGETAAVVNLCSIIGVNYGARLMAYRMRVKSERKTAPKQAPTQAPIQPVDIPIYNGSAASPPMQEKPTLTAELRKGDIPGVGSIEFPPDHPLMMGRKPN